LAFPGGECFFGAQALASLQVTPTLSQATILQYRSDVAQGRANIETAAANVSSAEASLRAAETALSTAESQLALIRAGSTVEDINIQKAALAQARANQAKVEAEFARASIRAPFPGVITRVDAKIGQIANTQTGLIGINSDLPLEIEANVPELEIGRIAKGNPVTISLDAFPNETFAGSVVAIDPAETLVDGVVNFKVTITFDRVDERFKSGLTATLHIETGRQPNALTLPFYALTEENGRATVQKLVDGSPVQTPVTVGARSSDGRVEIMSGLAEGDMVLAEPQDNL